MTIGTLSPTEKDLYKIVALVRQLAERNNSGVATTDVNDDAVTNAKLANMAQSTVKGRAAGAGPGDPTDLGVAQLIAILGIPANIRKFTSSGAYPTVTNGDVKVLMMAKGGGGGGGGSTSANFAGGSGGEGATSWKLTTASALGGQAVTIGAGGSNVAANTDTAGGNGGTSSIGTVATAPGGTGGSKGSVGGAGGGGGAGGTNDWGEPGISGAPGQTADGTKMIGATGGGRGGGIFGSAGVANSGGGGGPGFSAAASGAGGSGLIICIEFGAI